MDAFGCSPPTIDVMRLTICWKTNEKAVIMTWIKIVAKPEETSIVAIAERNRAVNPGNDTIYRFRSMSNITYKKRQEGKKVEIYSSEENQGLAKPKPWHKILSALVLCMPFVNLWPVS